MILLLPAVCLFACGLHLIFDAKGHDKLALKTKVLASLAMVGFAWDLGAWDSAYGRLILIGLILSLLGDTLLALKNQPQGFLLGLGAFLLAHVFYALAFAFAGINTSQFPLVLPVVMVVAILAALWLRTHLKGIFIVAVPVYLLAIASMLLLAWTQESAWTGVPAAATLFALSDLFVARNRLIQNDQINRVMGLPIYYIAQLLLAYSVIY